MSSFFKKIGKNITKPFSIGGKKSTAEQVVEQIGKLDSTANSQTLVKEGIRAKVVTYVKNVIRDYTDVGKESLKYASNNPFRTLAYGLISTSMVAFYKHVPNMTDYQDARKKYSNEMIMCGSTYSKRSEYYLNELNKLENGGFLEYKYFVLFSMVMIKRFNENDCTYENQCAQLNNPNKYNVFNLVNQFLKYSSRIVDFGFCNEWYFLNKNLKDYDVDEDEWKESNHKPQ